MDQAGAGARVPITDFDFMEVIGKGSYGLVRKARHRQSNEIRVLKKIDDDGNESGIPQNAIREMNLLKKMAGHDNIVRLHNFVDGGDCIYLVLECLDCNLRAHMRSAPNDFRDHGIVKYFLYQLLNGIAQCHSHSVIHRDLKPDNLLINRKTRQLKLADFGMARVITDFERSERRSYTPEVVTPIYRAPEILLGETKYGKPIDVWSVGCIFAEMVMNQQKPFFDGDTEIDLLCNIFSILGTPNEQTWPGITSLPAYQTFKWEEWPPQDLAKKLQTTLEPEGIDLLSKMLHLDPNGRISARAALKHGYFKTYMLPPM